MKVAHYPAVLYMQTPRFFTSIAQRSALQRLLEELRSNPIFRRKNLCTEGAWVAPGGSATSTIAPANGFNAAVALTCSVAPAATRGPTCAFNPASVAGGSGTSTLTVGTTAATTASLEAHSRGLFYAMLLPIGSGVPVGLPLFLTLIVLPACGGGSSSGGGGHAGTPPGTYTITVIGTSGSLTHSATGIAHRTPTPRGIARVLTWIESLRRPFGGICFMLRGRGVSCPEVLRPRLLFPFGFSLVAGSSPGVGVGSSIHRIGRQPVQSFLASLENRQVPPGVTF